MEMHASGRYYIKQGAPRLGKSEFIYSLPYLILAYNISMYCIRGVSWGIGYETRNKTTEWKRERSMGHL